MDDIVIARAIHVLAVVHWIGGVAFVTLVVLPAVVRFSEPHRRAAIFEEVEGRFSLQAKISVTLAGLSGFYMTHRLEAWDRFADPHYWWMHAMVLVWTVFTLVLFVGEPLFLHAWFERRMARDPDGTLAFVRSAHRVLLGLSAITVAAAVFGVRGALF